MLFLDGLLLGFGVSVPIGPINLLIMQASLRDYKAGLLLGFGALTADLFYLFLIFFGLFSYIESPIIFKSIQIFGGLFLLYLAIRSFQNKMTLESSSYEPKRAVFTYTKGFVATFLSPFNVVFWFSISSLISGTESPLLLVSGMMLAIVLWILFLVFFVYKSRSLLSPKAIKIFNILSGIVLLYIGSLFLYKAFG